ncbi:unnamed protein product, partial [Musa acuminata subsp. burmannicoides]
SIYFLTISCFYMDEKLRKDGSKHSADGKEEEEEEEEEEEGERVDWLNLHVDMQELIADR